MQEGLASDQALRFPHPNSEHRVSANVNDASDSQAPASTAGTTTNSGFNVPAAN